MSDVKPELLVLIKAFKNGEEPRFIGVHLSDVEALYKELEMQEYDYCIIGWGKDAGLEDGRDRRMRSTAGSPLRRACPRPDLAAFYEAVNEVVRADLERQFRHFQATKRLDELLGGDEK